MKIAIFSDTFYPSINGVVTALVAFANGLVTLGHQVLIVAPKPDKEWDPTWGIDENVAFFFLPSVEGRIYTDLRLGLPIPGVYTAFKTFDPDIVHTFTPFLVGMNGVLLAKSFHIPLLTSNLTNFTEEEILSNFKMFPDVITRTAHKGTRPLLRTFLHLHSTIIVPSLYTKKHLLDIGVKKPISVIPCPVPLKDLRAGKKSGLAMRKQLGIPLSLIYVGRLSPEKNIDRLIESFAILLRQFPILKLIIIGDGPEQKALFELAKKLKVNQSIVWTGAVPYTELITKGYYYLGDVFVTLSTMETQGISTVEAMACGLVVAGARAVATKEIIGENGLLISSTNPRFIAGRLGSLLENKKKLELLRKRSVLAVRNYSIALCARRLVIVYRNILQ